MQEQSLVGSVCGFVVLVVGIILAAPGVAKMIGMRGLRVCFFLTLLLGGFSLHVALSEVDRGIFYGALGFLALGLFMFYRWVKPRIWHNRESVKILQERHDLGRKMLFEQVSAADEIFWIQGHLDWWGETSKKLGWICDDLYRQWRKLEPIPASADTHLSEKRRRAVQILRAQVRYLHRLIVDPDPRPPSLLSEP